MFLKSVDYQTENSRSVIAVSGILQPVSKKNMRAHKFQLSTDNEVFYLDPPKALGELFKRHVWERFIIKGSCSANNVLHVKTARLENEDVPSFYDNSKGFDLALYRKMIDRGFPLEPKLEEIA